VVGRGDSGRVARSGPAAPPRRGRCSTVQQGTRSPSWPPAQQLQRTSDLPMTVRWDDGRTALTSALNGDPPSKAQQWAERLLHPDQCTPWHQAACVSAGLAPHISPSQGSSTPAQGPHTQITSTRRATPAPRAVTDAPVTPSNNPAWPPQPAPRRCDLRHPAAGGVLRPVPVRHPHLPDRPQRPTTTRTRALGLTQSSRPPPDNRR
jgi:hypothetical protein